MAFGSEFLASIFGESPKYTLKTPANRIPVKDLRKLAEENIDKDFVSRYLYEPSYMKDMNTIPEGLLRDALLGAQRSDNRSIRSDFGAALINRLNHYKPSSPHLEFSRTGEDYYRLMNPDEIVVPYARSYNDEQLIDLMVPKKQTMKNICD